MRNQLSISMSVAFSLLFAAGCGSPDSLIVRERSYYPSKEEFPDEQPIASLPAPWRAHQLIPMGRPADFYVVDPAKPYVNNKSGFYSVTAFEGRIYIGHGSTASASPTKVIYADPADNTLKVEQWGGKDLVIKQEALDQFKILNGDLYVNSRDAFGAGTQFIRKVGGSGDWVIRSASGYATEHCYGIHLDPRSGFIMTHWAAMDGKFPNILMTNDNGVSWSKPNQPELNPENKYVRMDGFFAFKGFTYVTRLSPSSGETPFMLKFANVDPLKPWVVEHKRYDDFYGDIKLINYTLSQAEQLGTKLLLRLALPDNGYRYQLFLKDDVSGRGGLVSVDRKLPLDGHFAVAFVLRDGIAYLLYKRERSNGIYEYRIFATQDGNQFESIVEFSSEWSFRYFDYWDDSFYLAGYTASSESVVRIKKLR